MKKGEVWKVRLPQAAGHVQAGERPAIIVQNDRRIASLPTVLIVPLTGTVSASRFDGTMVIPPNPQNGLSIPSVALVFQVRALDKQDFIGRLGEIDQTTLSRILSLIVELTG